MIARCTPPSYWTLITTTRGLVTYTVQTVSWTCYIINTRLKEDEQIFPALTKLEGCAAYTRLELRLTQFGATFTVETWVLFELEIKISM